MFSFVFKKHIEIKNQDDMEKKQKVEQHFGLRWFGEQQPALSQCTEESILIKDDMYKFACHPDRQEFVEEWCSPHDVIPIYEVITDGYARLHFDIESEYPGDAPPAEELQKWLGLSISVIKSALKEVGVEQKHRQAKDYHKELPNAIHRIPEEICGSLKQQEHALQV